jgi:phage recombination protein Bet
MAERYGMEPGPFEATVRAICMPQQHTREEFAAFLLVAKEYRLNPLTKEIYAFPKRGGGIVPIVSIDGWVSLVNSHDACDGFSFSWEEDADRNPISCTCTMYRKDRSHPVVVTEYLSECIRPTDPWKMKHRMLRHKAMIQGARYAFGFSGIYDEDEGAKIAEMRDITPQRQAVAFPDIPDEEEATDEAGDERQDDDGEIEDLATVNLEALLTSIDESMATATDDESAAEVWDSFDVEARLSGDEDGLAKAFAIRNRHFARLEKAAQQATEGEDIPT